MSSRYRSPLTLAALIGVLLGLTGCGLAGAVGSHVRTAAKPAEAANPGEPSGTIPAGADGEEQSPVQGAASPQNAIDTFGKLYVNWSYQTLSEHESELAAISVGAARLAERQAAAAAKQNTALERGQIYNRGTLIAVSPVLDGTRDRYAVVTREETGGNQEYAGLQAEFHVTLATVQKVSTGWAVSEWQPQS